MTMIKSLYHIQLDKDEILYGDKGQRILQITKGHKVQKICIQLSLIDWLLETLAFLLLSLLMLLLSYVLYVCFIYILCALVRNLQKKLNDVKKKLFFLTFSKKTETPPLPLFWPPQFFSDKDFFDSHQQQCQASTACQERRRRIIKTHFYIQLPRRFTLNKVLVDIFKLLHLMAE